MPPILEDCLYFRNYFSEFWDVTFRCEGGEVVKAHKFILMARSSYFEVMLGIRWNQARLNYPLVLKNDYLYRSIKKHTELLIGDDLVDCVIYVET